jgi:hypothetical protein
MERTARWFCGLLQLLLDMARCRAVSRGSVCPSCFSRAGNRQSPSCRRGPCRQAGNARLCSLGGVELERTRHRDVQSAGRRFSRRLARRSSGGRRPAEIVGARFLTQNPQSSTAASGRSKAAPDLACSRRCGWSECLWLSRSPLRPSLKVVSLLSWKVALCKYHESRHSCPVASNRHPAWMDHGRAL